MTSDRIISHYRILAELGRGGMGVVYKAEDTKLDRTVALKLLPLSALSSEDDRSRFYREARSAAALHHPNIGTVFEIDEHEGQPFIAMEYVDGQSLEERIKEGPLPLTEAVLLATQIAEGLQVAHARDIVHRDIKSANVMLAGDGRAKILDFGLAKTAASTKLTQMGSTMGTAAYMSPEQTRGQDVDHRSDLWSLGVVLYEMIAGKLPFAGDYEQAVVYSILNDEPQPLTAIRTGVPMELEAIASKALRKEPRLRYQTAADLIADLSSLELGSTSGTTTTTRIVAQPASHQTFESTHRPAMFWLAVAGLCIAFFVAGFLGSSYLESGSAPDTDIRRITETMDDLEWGEISPDGSTVAYVIRDTVYVRRLSSDTRIAVSNFRANQQRREVFWSPNSSRIGIVDGTSIRTVRLDGTGEVRLGDMPPSERVQGAVWTGDDEILVVVQYGGANGEVFSVPSEGGPINSLLKLTASDGDYSIFDIVWVPGADVVLAAATVEEQGASSVRVLMPSSEQEWLLDAELGAATQSVERLRDLAYDPSGYLLLDRVSGISVIALNTGTARPSGKQRIILPGLRGPSVAVGGLLVAHRINSERKVDLVLVDPETGTARSVATRDSPLRYPRFDDDGTRLVGVGAAGVTITDLVRGDSRRVHGSVPVVSDWLPGRGGILISGYNEGTGADILQIDPDGSNPPTPLVQSPRSEFYATVSPDHTRMMYYTVDPETGRDLWIANVEVANGRIARTSDPEPWLVGSNDDAVPVWHPSGDWVAYISNQTGEYRVYIRAFPSAGHEVNVSIGTGFDPAWSPDGRRIYYRGEDSIFAVDVLDLASMRLGKPRAVLSLHDRRISVASQLERSYAVHPVTGELLVSQFVGKRANPSLVFVDNWKALLGEQ